MKKSWNKAAIYGFVLWLVIVLLSSVLPFVFLFTPVFIFCGIVALLEIKKTGEKGKMVAIFLIFIGGIYVLNFLMGMMAGVRGS